VALPAGFTLTRMSNTERTPGLAGARNTGILAASGDYVAFCDDDDEWLPGRLAGQFEALRAHDPGGRAMASSGVVVVTESGTRVRAVERTVLDHADFVRDRIMEIHPSTFLIPREVLLEQVGLVDETLPGSYAEDYDLLLRYTRHHPVVVAQEPLVRVDFHLGSFYATNWEKISEGLEALLAAHPDFADDPRGLARIQGQLAFCRAALGERAEGRRLAVSAIRNNPREPRALVALIAGLGVPPELIVRLLRSRGRGI
jgi:glycosyltransferase involved in cell wall biosynthesis